MNKDKANVVYLIGAGASHASVKSGGGSRGILMDDLKLPLAKAVQKLVSCPGSQYSELGSFANDIVDDDVDVEQLITFLDESPAVIYRSFANELRYIFARILQDRLTAVEDELKDDRYSLYTVLLDMYSLEGCPEVLKGILSINYDEYVEAAAATVYGRPVDYGLAVSDPPDGPPCFRLLKLHGSFNWTDVWPVEVDKPTARPPLWIPPGIQKSKRRYPFSILWGLARELLDCDVLRIVGCRLSANDWDLISLLFSTRHARGGDQEPYSIEVVDCPTRAFRLQEDYPYLGVRSLFEMTDYNIGTSFIRSLLGMSSEIFSDLTDEQQEDARTRHYPSHNWFRLWLKEMAEALVQESGIDSTFTRSGEFDNFLVEY